MNEFYIFERYIPAGVIFSQKLASFDRHMDVPQVEHRAACKVSEMDRARVSSIEMTLELTCGSSQSAAETPSATPGFRQGVGERAHRDG